MTDGNTMADRRILVVGASAGIGRVVGQELAREGAAVAFAARRVELCEEAAKESVGGRSIGLACDVTVPEMCAGAVEAAVERLGGIDDVVYSAGLISLVAAKEADEDWWRRTFETNVMGASLITRAALPHVQRSGGSYVYLSSVAGHTGPWPGLGVYASSKAALNRMIDTWRSEHPDLGFARISVGPTADGATTAEADASAFPHQTRWAGLGLTSGAAAEARSIARVVSLILTEQCRIWDVTVQPRDPALPWGSV
jgi:NAD(P)-dependent dehydrogenase (short-subunit alcohol dehydrogenase family)